MTLASNLEAIANVLKLYADGWEFDDRGPHETTLLGTEFHQGKPAKEALPIVEQMQRSVDRLQQELAKLKDEKRQQVTVIAGIENQVLLHTWLASQRMPVFAQAWAGYLQQGKGMIAVIQRWEGDESGLHFSMEADYWPIVQISTLPEALRDEIMPAVEAYDPQRQAVIAFGGQDLSHRGKRHPFSLERSYFQLQTIEVAANETVPGLAEQLGVKQKVLTESSIDLE